jgi:dTMP kinase
LFVVIEGIDGAGTTTQTQLVYDELVKLEFEVVKTFEPTNREVGTLIRKFLKNQIDFNERVLSLLFAADRLDHIDKIIQPSLLNGKIVISDRYFLSSLAYQSLDADAGFIEDVNRYHRKPDITFLIDIDPEISLKRKQCDSPDAYEKLDLQKQIRENYLYYAAKYKNEHNVRIIQGNKPVEVIFGEIMNKIKTLI